MIEKHDEKILWKITCGVFPSNSYIYQFNGEGIVIDGGLDEEYIMEVISQKNITITSVYLTHGHFDHAAVAAHCQKKFNCKVYLHRDDLKTMQSSNFLLMACGIKKKILLPNATLVDEGVIGDIFGEHVEYHHVPGHTPGSSFIEIGRYIFTGDSVYANGIGQTGFKSEDFIQLKASLGIKKEVFNKDILICPGHGRSISGLNIFSSNKELAQFMENKHEC